MSLFIAFTAGLLTFFTPCVFPLIPTYISYITGASVDELCGKDKKALVRKSVISALFFVLGFSLVFTALGFSAAFVGSFLFAAEEYIRIIGGALVILFGLSLTGVLDLKFLKLEKRIIIKWKPAGYFGAFLVGMTFAAGWVPCVGPVLSSILVLASNSSTWFSGGVLLLFYCLGLGIPIVISAAAFNVLISFGRHTTRYLGVIQVVSGIFLMIVGLLLLTDNLHSISALIYQIFGYKGI